MSSFATPAPGPGFNRINPHHHDGRGIDPVSAALNTPDPARLKVLSNALTIIANEWSSHDHGSKDPYFLYLSNAWSRFVTALKAISATDFILQWDPENVLVERPGQRVARRRGEISARADKVRLSDEFFEWNLDSIDRENIARLMLLTLSGAPLEEANGLVDLKDTPIILATRLAVLEKLSGEKLFHPESPILLLEEIANFGATEKAVLQGNNLTKVVLVEGTRTPYYTPNVRHEPDTSTIHRILTDLGIENTANIADDQLGEIILQEAPLEEAVFRILMDSHRHHSDESFVVVRPSRDKVAVGDDIYAWAIVGGRAFRATAMVIQGESELKIEIIENATPYSLPRGPLVEQSWRRDRSTLDAFSTPPLEKIRTFRSAVIGADLMPDEEYALDPAAQSALKDAARRLFNRLLEHNLTASLNGRQQGATALQPGWHLSYDSNEDGTGYGPLNNPGHAMAGVQTMIRAPLYGSAFSHLRVWRERADWRSQYSLNDIRVFSAYHLLLDSLFIAQYAKP